MWMAPSFPLGVTEYVLQEKDNEGTHSEEFSARGESILLCFSLCR